MSSRHPPSRAARRRGLCRNRRPLCLHCRHCLSPWARRLPPIPADHLPAETWLSQAPQIPIPPRRHDRCHRSAGRLERIGTTLRRRYPCVRVTRMARFLVWNTTSATNKADRATWTCLFAWMATTMARHPHAPAALAGRGTQRRRTAMRGRGWRTIGWWRFDHGDADEFRGSGVEGGCQAAQHIGLRLFLAVLQMGDGVAAQIRDIRELADTEAAALTRLT